MAISYSRDSPTGGPQFASRLHTYHFEKLSSKKEEDEEEAEEVEEEDLKVNLNLRSL